VTTPHAIHASVEALAQTFAGSRAERLQRLALERDDFDAIAATGYLRLAVPVAHGGTYASPSQSGRVICQCLRALASADPSLGLVSAMHPGVLGFWSAVDESAPNSIAENWRAQRQFIFEAVLEGHWFGTVASEPGAGGDLLATRCTAKHLGDNRYAISGSKFMASGSGITSFMLTIARPEGEPEPDIFLLDTRTTPWDGSTGVTLTRAWDGAGMAATQSHAFQFEAAPATRYAWPHRTMEVAPRVLGVVGNTFTAVAMGILDAAITEAAPIMAARGQNPKALEKVEWARAVNNYWLAGQAYEAGLRAVERGAIPPVGVHRAKFAIAELAESVFGSLAKVLGGMTLSRGSPFAQWSQDIKALGHLRPPWALALDQLHDHGLAATDADRL